MKRAEEAVQAAIVLGYLAPEDGELWTTMIRSIQADALRWAADFVEDTASLEPEQRCGDTEAELKATAKVIRLKAADLAKGS